MVTPITSYPWSCSISAVTLLSTPPLMATNTRPFLLISFFLVDPWVDYSATARRTFILSTIEPSEPDRLLHFHPILVDRRLYQLVLLVPLLYLPIQHVVLVGAFALFRL